MLHINDLTYRIEGREILEHATAAIPASHKVGLVGRNGAGKSTLLRLIQGHIHLDDGSITTPRNCRIGAVAQEAPSDDTSLIETVLAADKERAALLREAETTDNPGRISEIQLRLADIEAHSAPARAATILAGLGFDDEAQAQPCSSFSGGWRMRVALAAVLFTRPDILLLDEPTNYLDLEGTLWLESYLRAYPFTILLVSHDRDLLNTCVNSILHLEGGRLKLYSGGYDYFERTRREQQELQLKLKAKQDDQRRHMEAFVERFRYKASKAKQAQSRVKALAKLQPIVSIVDEHTVPFHFNNPSELRSPIIRMEKVSVGYEPDKPVLRDITLRIDHDDRIALLGANGNGKSTFAKLISGRLERQSGELFRSKKLDIAYFAQHQLDELHPDETPYDHFRSLLGSEATQARVRAIAGSYGFGIPKADTKVTNLSGGEKARLLLALITHHGPNLLILDEPTNHLDVDSRESLIHAINDYAGTVILISHDRHLLETTADRIWIVENGGVKRFEGDLDDYRDHLLGRLKTQPDQQEQKSSNEQPSDEPPGKKGSRRQSAGRRKALDPMRRAVKKAEENLTKLQGDLLKIDRALAIPNIYRDAPEKAARFAKKRAELGVLIEDAEHQWLVQSEAYDAAKESGDRV